MCVDVPAEVTSDIPAVVASMAGKKIVEIIVDQELHSASDAYQVLRSFSCDAARELRAVTRICNVSRHGRSRAGKRKWIVLLTSVL